MRSLKFEPSCIKVFLFLSLCFFLMSETQPNSAFNVADFRRRNENKSSARVPSPGSTSFPVAGQRRDYQAFLSDLDLDAVAETSSPRESSSQNDIEQALKYARSLKLPRNGRSGLEKFIRDPPIVRQTKNQAKLVEIANLFEQIVQGQPQFEVDSQLTSNIKGLAIRHFCADNVMSYKKEADDLVCKQLGKETSVLTRRFGARGLRCEKSERRSRPSLFSSGLY